MIHDSCSPECTCKIRIESAYYPASPPQTPSQYPTQRATEYVLKNKTYHSAWRLKFSIYIIWYSPRNKSITLVYYVNIPSRSDSLVKSMVYKVYLRILQVPGISVNSHVAVIFLVFLIGKVENADICNIKSDWL